MNTKLAVIAIAIIVMGVGTTSIIMSNNKESPGPPECKGRDSDDDSISNDDEVDLYGTDPCLADTDGDGLSDFEEIFETYTNPVSNDSDNDSLLDLVDPSPNDNMSDLDGDGVLDQFDINWSKDVQIEVEFEVYLNGTENRSVDVVLNVEDEQLVVMRITSNYDHMSRNIIWNWNDSILNETMSLVGYSDNQGIVDQFDAEFNSTYVGSEFEYWYEFDEGNLYCNIHINEVL